MDQETEKPFMTAYEAADYLMVNKATLYSFVKTRRIPHYRFNKLIRFRKEELEKWTLDFHIDVHPAFRKRAEELKKKKELLAG